MEKQKAPWTLCQSQSNRHPALGAFTSPFAVPTNDRFLWSPDTVGSLSPGDGMFYSPSDAPSPVTIASPQTPTTPHMDKYTWALAPAWQPSSPPCSPSFRYESPVLQHQSPSSMNHQIAHAPTNSTLVPSLAYPNNHQALGSIPVIAPPASRRATSKKGPTVPQKRYTTHFKTGNPINVSFRQNGSNEIGFPMRLLLDETAHNAPLQGAHDQIFDESIPSTITLRIWWPGYEIYPRRITMRKATGIVNRLELAMILTECYRNFIDDARPPNVIKPQDLPWRVGRGYLGVRDLVLMSLRQVSQGSFQAEVRIEYAQ